MQIKMTNTNVFKEQESSFRFERLENNYSMQYNDVILNKESEGENDISALIYKLNGSGNTFQRFGIYSFRRLVRFVEDTTNNRKTLKDVNSKIKTIIETKGKNAVYSDFKEVFETINSLEFISPFQPVEGKDDMITVPDGIEIVSVLPKINVGLFDTPSNKSKLRYVTRAYKANSYIRKDNGQFAISESGESLSYTARELANNEQYDDITELYNTAEIEDKAAKDIRNIVFNSAICVVTND